jgi:hypothetical protein
VAQLVPNESLHYVAYQVLGQWPEGWLPDVVILWFVAMLVPDSQGKSRILGFIALSIAVCFELYSHILRDLGTSDTGILKLLMLLPFVWLLFESTKKPHLKGTITGWKATTLVHWLHIQTASPGVCCNRRVVRGRCVKAQGRYLRRRAWRSNR